MIGTVKVKEGVKFDMIGEAGFYILEAVNKVARTLKLTLTITSGTDGLHSGPADPHHTGEAYDIRTQDLGSNKLVVLNAIQALLDPTQFYGFLEAPGTSNEHLHFQRKRGTVFPPNGPNQ